MAMPYAASRGLYPLPSTARRQEHLSWTGLVWFPPPFGVGDLPSSQSAGCSHLSGTSQRLNLPPRRSVSPRGAGHSTGPLPVCGFPWAKSGARAALTLYLSASRKPRTCCSFLRQMGQRSGGRRRASSRLSAPCMRQRSQRQLPRPRRWQSSWHVT